MKASNKSYFCKCMWHGMAGGDDRFFDLEHYEFFENQ